jgi:hypothetical protein
MSKNKIQIDRIRELVRVRLGQLTCGSGEFRETYLMSDSKFSGIRFDQGPFKAIWKLDESAVRVLRDEQQILLIENTQPNAGSRAA